MTRTQSIVTRWLGVGLALVVCVVTLGLSATGRIGLYINPDGAWFAVGMSVVGVIAAIGSFLLPLGEEADHGHDHGEAAHAVTHPFEDHHAFHVAERAADTAGLSRREIRELREAAERTVVEADSHDHHDAAPRRRLWPTVAAVSGGVIASAVVVLMLVLPPASLSAQAAADRDIGSPPLFGGDDVVVLAASGDVASFGIGEWATVFATAGDPAAFDGVSVTLTGFLTEGPDGAARLSRLVVTHCVIDAQPASVTLAQGDADAAVGQWLQVDGVVEAQGDGSLVVMPTTVTAIAEPTDPYEY